MGKLEGLRHAIQAKRGEVDHAEAECRKAWGKKWSYIQMQRRRSEAGGGSRSMEMDGQAEVFELRRQQFLAELRERERELDELLAKEMAVAADLGEKPITPPEVHGEER